MAHNKCSIYVAFIRINFQNEISGLDYSHIFEAFNTANSPPERLYELILSILCERVHYPTSLPILSIYYYNVVFKNIEYRTRLSGFESNFRYLLAVTS